jgi:hypothetical protein
VTITVVIPSWQRAPWLSRGLVGLIAADADPGRGLSDAPSQDREAGDVVRRADFALPVRGDEVHRPGHIAPVLAGLKEALRYPSHMASRNDGLVRWVALHSRGYTGRSCSVPHLMAFRAKLALGHSAGPRTLSGMKSIRIRGCGWLQCDPDRYEGH